LSTQHNANTNPDDLVRYTELVAALEKVRAANLITDEEYQTMKAKFMADYKVNSDWIVGRNDAALAGQRKGARIYGRRKGHQSEDKSS
jgi:hypothetical protein